MENPVEPAPVSLGSKVGCVVLAAGMLLIIGSMLINLVPRIVAFISEFVNNFVSMLGNSDVPLITKVVDVGFLLVGVGIVLMIVSLRPKRWL